jgi:hypothetical protein
MRRKLALPLAFAVLALCLTPRAPAQEPLTELWSEYPLYQPDEQPAAQAAEPESRSAQEPETPVAPEPEAPVPAGQERSSEGSTEAIGSTADGPETLPWILIAALTWAAITLTLLLVRLIPAPTVPLHPPRLAEWVVRLAVVTRERGRRGLPARRGGRRGPPPTPRPPPAGTKTSPPARGPDLEEEDEEEEEELLPAALAHLAGEVRREEDAAAPASEEEQQLEFCAIEWWHGYVKSHFYARALGPDGRLYVAARSPKFLCRQGGAPEPTKSARAAHAAIVEQLAQEGWELSRADGCDWAWYAACFSRERPECLGDVLERPEDS